MINIYICISDRLATIWIAQPEMASFGNAAPSLHLCEHHVPVLVFVHGQENEMELSCPGRQILCHEAS